jgi:hypothetical protein
LDDRYIKYKDEFDRKNNEIDREKIFWSNFLPISSLKLKGVEVVLAWLM